MRLRPLLSFGLIGLLLACGSAPAPTAPSTPDPTVSNPSEPDPLAPDFKGGGQPGNGTTAAYPGPYGVGIGSVIPNYEFLGYPRASTEATELRKIQLADFYNPTGTGVYPAGSPYGEGRVKPKALLIDRSAVWCGPCNYEAKNELPGKHLKYAPDGEFLVALDEGGTPGTSPTQGNLDGWVNTYKLDYPAVLNPAATLSAIVGIDAYPGHIIVRTRDMKIVTWIAGVPGDAFWKLYEDTLAGKGVLPGE